ncbi:hypothetical protein MUG12_18045 [Escherichia albertii NBRC 107761 = DSM 17582]|uniref:hypothetical protein n=1 Tax=Escherichia TaxID=561 RepID=UPI0005005244|nr:MULTISPECIES: hypothetical protein [Escherichia]EFB7458479.1 hypothetical protein [Escherichia albertii]EHY3390260.1 hypothetical protein [Escherichia coli]EKG0288892.1 hypothetical protein [Escherichia albertii]MCJ2198613.1 hypothetical protein [Escherichia albertii NBRC 107761 = DSM 17582]MCZ8600824.1 hypothetical protein [Escherichia albertii]
MKYTKKLVALHKDLSLIESAMVLAISATITSGILYYYNHAKENHEPAVPDEEVFLEVFHHPFHLTFGSGPSWIKTWTDS